MSRHPSPTLGEQHCKAGECRAQPARVAMGLVVRAGEGEVGIQDSGVLTPALRRELGLVVRAESQDSWVLRGVGSSGLRGGWDPGLLGPPQRQGVGPSG